MASPTISGPFLSLWRPHNERARGCEARRRKGGGRTGRAHGERPIVETFAGKTVWQGIVEVFRVGLPSPINGYGWAVESPRGQQFVAVLGEPPIDSPIKAARAWIVSQVKK